MTLDHTLIEELLAVRSLGGLDGEDLETLERELTEHGVCDECRRLQDGFDETAGRLAFALEPVPVDPAMADRILSEAWGPEVQAVDELAERRAGRWRRALAVAASFVALVAGIAVLRDTVGVDPVARQRFLVLEGDEGSLALAYTPGERGIVVWGQDLPDPGAGNVYELWAFADGTPISQGCLEPSDGNLAAFLDAEIGDAQLMAVTVESAACPDSPTKEPVYTGELV